MVVVLPSRSCTLLLPLPPSFLVGVQRKRKRRVLCMWVLETLGVAPPPVCLHDKRLRSVEQAM